MTIPPDLAATLRTRIDEALARGRKVAARLRHAEGLPDDWPERASLLGDEDVLAALDEGARSEVAALRRAIERVVDGSWGTCERCGAEIPAARMASLPLAVTCVDCAD